MKPLLQPFQMERYIYQKCRRYYRERTKKSKVKIRLNIKTKKSKGEYIWL